MTFLICGLGSIGKRHLKILKGLGNHEFIALRSGKSGKGNSEGLKKEIYSADEIAGLEIDATLITNPTSLHIESAAAAASYGLPLFIEKPLGKNLEGVDKLRDVVSKKNIPVLMGYNMLFHPGIKMIKKLMEEKKIGRVISARAQFGTYMPGWHKGEDYKNSYAARKSMGGGVILTSIHEQNYLTDLFGDVIDVKAMELGGDVTGIETEEGVEILFRHSSGVVSNIHLNFFQKPYYRNCQIIGTEGTIYWDFKSPVVKIFFEDKTEVVELGNDYLQLLNESYENQMRHFIDVVAGKAEPRVSLEKGIKDLDVSLKILRELGRN